MFSIRMGLKNLKTTRFGVNGIDYLKIKNHKNCLVFFNKQYFSEENKNSSNDEVRINKNLQKKNKSKNRNIFYLFGLFKKKLFNILGDPDRGKEIIETLEVKLFFIKIFYTYRNIIYKQNMIKFFYFIKLCYQENKHFILNIN